MLMPSLRAVLALLIFISSHGWADELSDLKARNAQLEATVEELTLQLAETLSERKALEARLEEAVAARMALEQQLAGSVAAAEAGVVQPASLPGDDVSSTLAAPVAAATADPNAVTEEPIMPEAGSAAAVAQSEVQESTQVVNTACDVEEALRGYKRSGKANRALGEWLKASNHLKVCSTDQLKQIRKAVKFDFLGYEKEVLAMIDKELGSRET